MLYGIEVNEPYQVNSEYKLRCLVVFEKDAEFGWKQGWTPHTVTEKERRFDPKTGVLISESEVEERPNPRAFAVPGKEHAQQVADLLPATVDANVVPVEDGTVFEDEDLTRLQQTLGRQRRIAVEQARQVR